MTRNTGDEHSLTGGNGEPSANRESTPEAGDQSSPGADGPSDGAADAPEADVDTAATSAAVHGTTTITNHKPPEQEAFDWRGWLLVGVVVLSFLVVPAVVLFLPQLHGVLSRAGLSLTQTYLVFPMIPALLLGSIAVWAAVRSRTGE